MRAKTIKSTATVFTEAMRAYEIGKPGEARRLARQLVEASPAFGGAHYLLGLLALDQNQGKRAAGHLATAIAITPGQAALHLAMGRALDICGEHAEACLHFRTVLGLQPYHAEAHARLGHLLRQQGRNGDAITHCRHAVTADPGHAEAWNTLGALLNEIGEAHEAAQCLRRALQLRPAWPSALNNFGLALKECGNLVEAATILEGAVDIRPDHAGTRTNLASVYRHIGQLEKAREHAEKATKLSPRNCDAWVELGLVRQAQGHEEGAAAAFDHATAIAPDHIKPWFCLAEACRALGQVERAAQAYRHCLTLDPDDTHGAGLGLALTGTADTPQRAPQAYVRQLFDEYADRFDSVLVNALEYRGPALLADALARCLERTEGMTVLDAGCGTGLAAPVLRPLALTLDGLDLSPAMVAKARERGLYDHLHEAELEEFLNISPDRYDLIAAADVIVYMGNLTPVLAAARNALRDDGVLAFTLEKAEDSDSYMLGAKHRYAHGPRYVREQADFAGFAVALLEDAVTRKDGGVDVPGMVVVLRKLSRKGDQSAPPET
ncbi:tetratricopeptide repeat protein [Magnetospirillum sulfuroxidans]|uniref:Tetratricopeptide repeat protein n=1 Tax=Magnetospirillum sulfuroxidans TaxID=611300 RepID=A0ABS5IA43_9PROT|nr:tetratricopeptide repeat protein [Magnetospirillum sulfuroxidans]MBR9971293.1 tetratricopeptide repeat protein [Magnetospirillum sulfuroxidans]